ncbi:MAG: universal stress protein [Candidatus Tectomicrobia bacterium]|nr:universal stress protein [Candidatus Tectomicrobia bacterium]
MAYKYILAPTDFSDPSNHALHYAFAEAEQHHAALTLLHVLPHEVTTEVYYVHGALEARTGIEEVAFGRAGFDPESGSALPLPKAPAPETIRRYLDEEALEKLREQVPDSFKGMWDATVTTGKAADTILQTAQEQKVDLIVMGTHGRTGLSHTLFGSVAEAVMRHARCPVLMVRHAG